MSDKSDFQEHLEGWFVGRLPGEWFTGAPEVTFDRDEILVVGTLSDPDLPDEAGLRRARRRRRLASRASAKTPVGTGCGSPTRPNGASDARAAGAPAPATSGSYSRPLRRRR